MAAASKNGGHKTEVRNNSLSSVQHAEICVVMMHIVRIDVVSMFVDHTHDFEKFEKIERLIL
jgi:hypothetical protein